MGCWNETCAITQQGFTGPAYCIITPLEHDFNIRIMFNLYKSDIAIGDLNYYGELEDISESTNPKIKYESPAKKEQAVIFVQKHAWEKTIEWIKQDGLYGDSWEELKEHYEDFYLSRLKTKLHNLHWEWWLIQKFLNIIRRNFIFNNEFTGSQTQADDALIFANSLIVKRPLE